MAALTLKLKKGLFVPKFFPLLFDYSHRWEVYMGSAGSAKSYFITQKLIVRACSQTIKIMVCRRYGTTIRNTCFALFKRILKRWGLYPNYCKIRESDFAIKFANGSEIIFMGLDEETKLLSLDDISVIFVEEAFEVPKTIVEQLSLRMRSDMQNQQIILAFNPISQNHWLYEFCEIKPPSSFVYIHSTYKDNPFLGEEYIKELEELYTRNPAKARIFCDGQWGVDSEGLVLKNWRVEEFDPMELAKTLEHRAGMDLGWIDKSAIINTLYDREKKIIYVFDEFYRSGCQLSELAAAIIEMNLKRSKIYIDAAEPRTIQFFKSEGIRAEACSKGKDSVKAGLMFLQDHLIIVHPKCKHFKTELENFSYIKSKVTGEWTEDTTHEWSHAIDACRYAYSDIYTSKKIKVIDFSL
jgi:phage terminase large subunit